MGLKIQVGRNKNESENVRICEDIFEDQKIFENIDKIEHKHDDDDEMS